MCATADRQARRLLRLAAIACLVPMMIGIAEPSLASAYDAGPPAEAVSQASCDAQHSDSGCSHPDHADESDIPAVATADGLGPPHRLYSHYLVDWTAVPQRPPVRPPSF